MDAKHVELRAEQTLLERGVRVQGIRAPFLLRLFGVKELRVKLRQPTLGELFAISGLVVGMGLDPTMGVLSLSQAYELVHRHGHDALRVLTIATRPRWMPRRLYTRWLGRHITPATFAEAWMAFVSLNGVADFTNTIRLMTTVNNLSPTEQGSQRAE